VAAWLALGLGLGFGCQLVVDLDGLADEQCAPDEKPCRFLKKCAKKDNPETRCGQPQICAPCNLPNAQSSCMLNSSTQEFECAIALCTKPYLDCDPALEGCETDPLHDPNRCGATQPVPGQPCTGGTVCTTLPNALAPACSGGECTIGGCKPGFAHCDDDIPNGCETPVGDGGCPE
jgi:hypothetical protein